MMICEHCHGSTKRVLLNGMELWCQSCMDARDPKGTAPGVIGDECDLTQENGFRHPRRFTSKRELTRALAEQGKELYVRHMPVPGTDKSPHTTDWSKGSIDPYTLEAARVLAERQAHTKATNDPEPEPIEVQWQVRDVSPHSGAGPWRDAGRSRI